MSEICFWGTSAFSKSILSATEVFLVFVYRYSLYLYILWYFTVIICDVEKICYWLRGISLIGLKCSGVVKLYSGASFIAPVTFFWVYNLFLYFLIQLCERILVFYFAYLFYQLQYIDCFGFSFFFPHVCFGVSSVTPVKLFHSTIIFYYVVVIVVIFSCVTGCCSNDFCRSWSKFAHAILFFGFASWIFFKFYFYGANTGLSSKFIAHPIYVVVLRLVLLNHLSIII